MGARRLRFASVTDSVPEQHEQVMNGDWNLCRLRLEKSPTEGKCTSPALPALSNGAHALGLYAPLIALTEPTLGRSVGAS